MNGVKQAKKKLKINFNGRESRRTLSSESSVVRIEERWMDVRCKIGKLDLCPKVVAVAVEHFVAIDGVENGSKSSGYHLYLNKGVPGEHIIQVGEGVVDILPQPVLNGDEAADTVVWVVVRPGTGTISIDVVIVNPLFYAV